MSAGRSRRLIALGALAAAVGLAIAATAPIGGQGGEPAAAQQFVGAVVVAAGWAVLAWGIHRFGRDPEDRT